MKPRRLLAAAETAVLILTAILLVRVLIEDHGVESEIREHIVEHGAEETGALNLVTAIYLGYRAFDTLGETLVLLVAVSGVLYFLTPERRDDEKENIDT